MIVKELVLRNFRNYDYLHVNFDPKLNFIVGDNAVGKTNIVEAIHYLSIARSFRGAENAELIQNGRQFATIEAEVVEDTITNKIVALMTSSSKKVSCNGKQLKKISDLSKLMNVIVFEPKDSLMFSDSPMVRRNFLDINLSKKSLFYLDALMKFEKLLRERNSVLKSSSIDKVQLQVITDQLIKVEKTIITYREDYVKNLNKILSKIISNLKGEDQNIQIEYKSFINMNEEFESSCARAYECAYENDLKAKATTIGIHREDFKMILNGEDISTHGSQGENRIAVIALKLAPYFLIEDKNKKPIIVLDDVLSELDKEHQQRLLQFVNKLDQVFITATNVTTQSASVYEVKNHKITRRN